MSSQSQMLLLTMCVILSLLLLILCLGTLLWKLVLNQQKMQRSQLVEQMMENQALRNQLLALGDPERVAHLNYATLPSTRHGLAGAGPVVMSDLGEAINFEEGLAKNGYSIGDLDHGLESAGWTPAVIKRDGEDP